MTTDLLRSLHAARDKAQGRLSVVLALMDDLGEPTHWRGQRRLSELAERAQTLRAQIDRCGRMIERETARANA